jgi:hypothetical protein
VKFDVDLGRDTRVGNVEKILTKIKCAAELLGCQVTDPIDSSDLASFGYRRGCLIRFGNGRCGFTCAKVRLVVRLSLQEIIIGLAKDSLLRRM